MNTNTEHEPSAPFKRQSSFSTVMTKIADDACAAGGERTTKSVANLQAEVRKFTENFANAVSEADDRAESIVLNFCECQKQEIRARMRMPAGYNFMLKHK